MDWWQAIVLGLVQGIAEFLPISSSGHLVLVRALMGLEAGLFFDVMLHLATLAAVVIVLYKEIIQLFKPPYSRILQLIVACIPAVVVGFACKDVVETTFGTPTYLCFFFLVTAILMFVTEMISKRNQNPQKFGWKHAIAMGLMQGVGVFPGVSRSGSTIFGGTVTKAERKQVATFSFLLSIPIILGSVLITGIDLVQEGGIEQINVLSLIVGMVTAFASGYVAIKVMFKLIEKANFKWFSVYLLILACVLFGVYFIPAVV